MKKTKIILILFMLLLPLQMVLVPTEAGAASAGDLIKTANSSSVYFLGADNRRYVFPDETTYFSWYPDFSGVITISSAEMASYPLGENITIRPGTYLVKIVSDPKVYAVEPGGVLRHIVDEAAARALYGPDWNQRIVDVADAFFANYNINVIEVAAAAYPAGSLVRFENGQDIYYVAEDGRARPFADMGAFNANHFRESFVIVSDKALPPPGPAITGQEQALVDITAGAGGVPATGADLDAFLSPDSPDATTYISNQTGAELAVFAFHADNSGPVEITRLRVKRIGISADSSLRNVYLYNGNDRLTDGASVSSGYMTWNNPSGIFTVPAGQTVNIRVRADLSANTGETIGASLESASDITTNGASVSGTFPVRGETHSIASVTLGSVSFNANTLPTDGTTVEAGDSGVSVWRNSVTIGNRAVDLRSIRFRQIGSISSSDLGNFEFFVDGVQRGEADSLAQSGYLLFDFSSDPLELETGTRVLEIRADIVSGANRTFSFSVQYGVDVEALDSEYGVGVNVTGLPATSGTQNIDVGTLGVSKSPTSPSGSVTKDASNAVLAKYEFKAYGEAVKVEHLRVTFDSSDNDVASLRNGALYANGVQVGSTATLEEQDDGDGDGNTYTDFNLGSSLVINPGTTVVLEVRADIHDNSGSNDLSQGDTLRISLLSYPNAAQRQNSLTFFDAPSSDVPANSLTVAVGDLSLARQGTYTDRSITVPQADYKLASFVLTGNSTETVNLNTVNAQWSGTGTFSVSDLSNVYITYGDKTSSIKSSVNSGSNTWSINYALGVNQTIFVEVYANIGSGVTPPDSITTKMEVSGITAQSGQVVNTGQETGQTISAATGTINADEDASGRSSALVKGDTTIDAASFEFTTINERHVITELVFRFEPDAATVIERVILMNGTVRLGEAVLVGTDATFSGLATPVDINSSLVLNVDLELGTVNYNSGISGANVGVTLQSMKALDSQGIETTGSGTPSSGSDLYVYRATPTISTQNLPSSILVAGVRTISKFTVTGDGTIGWKKVKLDLLKSGDPVLQNFRLYDDATGQEVQGAVTALNTSAGDTTGSITFVADNEQSVSGSKTYVLKASISGTIDSGDYVSTNIDSGVNSHNDPTDYASVDADATFVWSDRSALSHSENTSDWNDDHLVRSLPTDSQNLLK